MQFVVTALTGNVCEAVQIRPENSIYPAIYSRIFGPADYQQCVEFVAAHTAQCLGVGVGVLGRGGVFPFRSAGRAGTGEDAGRPFPWSLSWDREVIGELATETALTFLPSAKEALGKVLVSTVDMGVFAIIKTQPSKVSVQAFAQVPTLGYSEPEVKVFGTALPSDGVVTAGVFAKSPAGLAAQVVTPVVAEGVIEYEKFGAEAIRAIHLVGSQGSLLCLPGNNGPYSRQVDGSRLVRGTGELEEGVECFLIIANRDTYSIGTRLPDGCSVGDRVNFTGVRMDISFCMQGTPLSLLSATKV